MRFLSSSALASAEKLRLAASCSAAETMREAPVPAPTQHRRAAYMGIRPRFDRGQAPSSALRLRRQDLDRAAGLLDRAPRPTSTRPRPRNATLALSLAGAEQPHAVLGAAQHAGSDQRRGIDRWRRRRACRRRSPPARVPRLTSLSLSANGVFVKPRLGSRRCSGIWPPSKPLMRTPERAVWPLPPRPPVLPVPGADAAPDADALLARARPVGEFVEASSPPRSLHVSRAREIALHARTHRCVTLAIMPRVAGVSGSSRDAADAC